MVMRARWVMAAVLLGGCLQPGSHNCDDRSVCPSELRCAETDDGSVCVAATCGNGRLDPGEGCDDGNNRSGDGCSGDCSAACGNDKLDPGEDCDDGNSVDGDGCASDCRFEVCGNGVVDPGEDCDDNNLQSHDRCSARCTAEPAGWIALYAAPEPRAHPAMAYDAARGTVLLFGGHGAGGTLRDTWVWAGTAWSLRRPALVPPARAGHAMAYDAARGRVVMFGGGGAFERSTWEWDGGTWIERVAGGPPSRLVDHAMTYDAGRHKVVLFGGALDGVAQDATWEWDGERWSVLASATVPPARAGHVLGYDSRRGKVVLFGGTSGEDRLGDTWELDEHGWTPRSVLGPPARANAAMTFAPATGRLVLFGGDNTAGALADTWAWDGSQWLAQDPQAPRAMPRGRSGPAMASDLRGAVVLFGGEQAEQKLLNETWAWDRAGWHDRTAAHAEAPIERREPGLVYDPVGERLVLFGGFLGEDAFHGTILNDTWAFDGASWGSATTEIPPRTDATIAARGGQVVLFGGERNNFVIERLDDTWVLDGTRWVRRTTDVTPHARSGAAMAYDAGRGKLVLFGGASFDGTFGVLDDTWEWDGQAWAQVGSSGPPGPSGRFHQGMAYDARRGRVVMFGGNDGFRELDDTWEWDGTSWTRRSPVNVPAPQYGSAMAYDAARSFVVLYSGSELWEWDGANWLSRAPATLPSLDGRQAMTYDSGRGCVVMSSAPSGASTAIWEWDGTNWRRSKLLTLPFARTAAAMAYDSTHATAVMFGGAEVVLGPDPHANLGETWLWGLEGWREATPAVSPPPRVHAAMAFDRDRKRTVLFGGFSGIDARALGDTWEWDGSAWQALTQAIRPFERSGHAMVYDAARKQTLMIGGSRTGIGPPGTQFTVVPLADQWAWDGTRWTNTTPSVPPPARTLPAAAYDPVRAEVVLFGGYGQDYLGDTWEWNGSAWRQRTVTPSPPARFGHTLVYDATRGRTVLFGGYGKAGILNDVWEWDGRAWTALALDSQPPARAFHTMVYDDARGSLVVFAGNAASVLRDTWLLRQSDPAIADEACQTGLDGDGDGRAGCADPDCGPSCARCGDGVCDPAESCRLCSGDCGPCQVCGDLQCDPTESCASCPGDCGPC